MAQEVPALFNDYVLDKRFRIVDVLGMGGFGITYLAHDTRLDVKVVVKEYCPNGCARRKEPEVEEIKANRTAYVGTGSPKEYDDRADLMPVIMTVDHAIENSKRIFDKGIDNLMKEARVMAQFDNVEGIVEVRDFFKANGTAYIIMDYIEGADLEEYVARKSLSFDELLNVMHPVFNALKMLHRKEIYHCDISPDNIMISDVTRRAVLIDFGSTFVSSNSKDCASDRIETYKRGYSPIEQEDTQSNVKIGPWTDIYALGVTIYNIHTGLELKPSMDRYNSDHVIPLYNVDSEKANAIMKAISVNAADRWQSIDDFEKVLYKTND